MKIKLQVGQKLWYVSIRHGESHEAVVTKVGRKWATIGEGWRAQLIDLVTMQADGKGYSSPGRCYLSREAHEMERARSDTWSRFVNVVKYKNCPAGVTTDDIKQAMQLLKLCEKD